MNNSTLRVLVVEDDPIQQKITTITLASLGATVDTAPNGKQALCLFKRNDYDLIFMDIGLPDTTGIDITRSIRNIEKTADNACVPIIALTAHDDAELKEQTKEAGMQRFHNKPLLKQEAKNYIDQLVATKQYHLQG